jgi:RPA family protein
MEKKRLDSVKTKIKQITSGKYVPADGLTPGYVLSPFGTRLSRVRLLGTVVDKFVSESGKFASITLDDGSDTIRAKVFNAVAMYEKIDAGLDIDLVGRVKEYQGEVFLAPEIITVLDDPNFSLLRELEIRAQLAEAEKKRKIVLDHRNQVADVSELQRLMQERFGIQPEEVEAFMQTEIEEPKDTKNKESILSLIEKLDEGSGCDYMELIKAAGLPEDAVESTVNELLEEGLCFEPRPGKIKKL